MVTIGQIMDAAVPQRASDIHIAVGGPVRIRVDGKLVPMGNYIMSHEEVESICIELSSEAKYDTMRKIGEVDEGWSYKGRRCRVHLFRRQHEPAVALRLLNDDIPDMEKLRLPPAVHKFPDLERGIVIVTGETGAGKSTTLASIINTINQNYPKHIVTLEDPIEYLYEENKCYISQRQIGVDTVSYAEGLRASLREDPDVILIGEMRDPETVETALTAAETGHLVFGTLHTNSCADSIDRLVDVFPEARQNQIRLQLSQTLQAVVSQQLLPHLSGKGRVAAVEVMVVNSAIRNLIREAKTPQIANTIATSAHEGSVTMDNALAQLALRKLISHQDAIGAAVDREYVKKQLMTQGRGMAF